MFIDTHAHLDITLQQTELELSEIISDSVRACVQINLTPEAMTKNHSLLSHDKRIYFASGFYPDFAGAENFDMIFARESLEYCLDQYAHIAIGEAGIDLKYESYGSLSNQQKLFELHLELGEKYNLPVIIHSRESFYEVWELVKQSSATVIMHCFSYNTKEAELILQRGDIISFAGNLSYKNAPNLHQVADIVPLDQLFFETDCPYLSPVPKRSKKNQPSYIEYTYQFFAERRMIEFETLCQQVQNNVERVLGVCL